MILYESLRTAIGNPGGAGWTTFVPSWTNLTVGAGGTNTGRYTQIGQTVIVYFRFVFGAGSAVSTNARFTMPVAALATYGLTGTGSVYFEDVGVSGYTGIMRIGTANATPCVLNSAGTYALNSGIDANVPFTWATSDLMAGIFTYEAA